jgi:hypothetical protein
MDGIYFDPDVSAQERVRQVYDGKLLMLSPCPASLELIAFARGLVEEAFKGYDPRTAHQQMPVEQYVKILAVLKPRFIHHPRCKELLREVFKQKGFDPDAIYFDVPRMRTAAPSDYLTTGIAYAFHPHRDTWYSAPQCQVNWWMPIWPVQPENAMAFHNKYWSEPVKNGSRTYNYKRWNLESRFAAAQQIGVDTRPQPKPEEPVMTSPYVCLLPPPGGMIMFSGAQLHSTIPNTSGLTRFSIDFRTVMIDDVWKHRGAHNIDSACTGTSLGDFLRASDFERIPQSAVELYDTPDTFIAGSSPAATAAR